MTPKILLISPGFAAHEQDHNCLPMLQLLVQEFLRLGLDIQIVALEYPFSDVPYRWQGAQVFPCNGQNRRWRKARTLSRAIRHCQTLPSPVQLHSFWLGWASFVGEWVARKQHLPHFTTLMGQDVLPLNRFHWRGLDARRCERLIAVSDFQNDVLEKNTGLRAAQVIPWGIPALEKTLLPIPNRPQHVLGVGNLIPIKNWDKWLKTIALAVQQKPDLQVELIGDGPERLRLESLSQQLGLGRNLCFSGRLPRPEVLARMQNTRVLLHTSDFESYGFVFAEAAGCGMRLVSTPVGVASTLGARCATEPEMLSRFLLETLSQSEANAPTLPWDIAAVAEAYRTQVFSSALPAE